MEQWAEDEVERELADWIASAACWGGREGGGGGEWVFGSWLRELFARVLFARVVFIEGARAFKRKKYILERRIEVCGVWVGVHGLCGKE